MRALVTGATGFLGRALVLRLVDDGFFKLRAASRREEHVWPDRAEAVQVGDLGADTDWSDALRGVGVVIHAAARVHVMKENVRDPISEFRRVNVEGSLNLARQAAKAGVWRFVFISSIKVNGELTEPGSSFSADDAPNPQDPYGVAKMETECGLYESGAKTGMEIVCIRPPLVYGPGVKANFLSMIRWIAKGFPLPFGSVENKRSFVGLDNLVDLIVTCIDHRAAMNETFLVSDDEDMSTNELVSRMSAALGKRPRLFHVPMAILRLGARLACKEDFAKRLLGNLQVDISKTKDLLGWIPPVKVDQGLQKTADWFLKHEKNR